MGKTKKQAEETIVKIAETTTTPEPTKEAPSMNKAEAVRQALAAGIDNPKDGSEYIKSRFGLDVEPKMFSVYKSKESGKEGQSTRTRKATIPAPTEEPTISDLLMVKEMAKDSIERISTQMLELSVMADQVGGFAKLRKCLEVLQKLHQ